jgi:hypothetical protein
MYCTQNEEVRGVYRVVCFRPRSFENKRGEDDQAIKKEQGRRKREEGEEEEEKNNSRGRQCVE